MALTAGLWAQNTTNANSANAGKNASEDSAPAGDTIRVTRASTYLGTDVMASDGRKVGDIVDYYFDTSAQPHLRYVVVMTGGFMGYGGDARAVPASAITTKGDSARIGLSSDEYWDAPVLPQNRDRYLADSRNSDRLAQAFKVSDDGTQNGNKASQDSGGSDSLISFTALTNEDVFDRDGNRIGRFEDTWLNLDANRAPYAEISSPPRSPFEVTPRYRYAIPLKEMKVASADGMQGVRFDITESDVRNSDTISETQGVQLLRSGDIGKEILRVRVAQR